MAYNLIVKEDADQDIAVAYLYYEERLEGLGDRFLRELQNRYNQLKENPKHYGFISVNDPKSLRKVVVNHFPYLVVYQIIDEHVIIHAIHNSSRENTKFL